MRGFAIGLLLVAMLLVGCARAKADDVTWNFNERLTKLEKRVEALEAKKVEAKAAAEAVKAAAPPVLRTFTATNGVTYANSEEAPDTFVPVAQQTFAMPGTVAEQPRLRQIVWQTPRMSGRVCVGPNCPQR